MEYHRGEIYYIYPKEAIGSEMSGGRPGIIISNDVGNEFSRVVEVVYLTTRDKKPLPTHVMINSAKYPSTVLCEQIETVSKDRIGNYLNAVTEEEMKELEKAILVSLDISSNVKGSKKLAVWEKLIHEWEDDSDGSSSEEEIVSAHQQEARAIAVVPTLDIEMNPKYIEACAQRDVYKELYMNLIKEIKGVV